MAAARGAVTTTKLADGSHGLTATDTVSGVTSTASAALAVTVDTVAPNAPIETGRLDRQRGTTKVTILTGTAEANSTLHGVRRGDFSRDGDCQRCAGHGA